jgi:hypothetical protein
MVTKREFFPPLSRSRFTTSPPMSATAGKNNGKKRKIKSPSPQPVNHVRPGLNYNAFFALFFAP